MVTPLPHSGADSSLMERVIPPSTTTTPGGMVLNLSPRRPPNSTPKIPDHYISDWDEFFLLFKQFKQREGHCNIPALHLESGKKLGFWLMAQHIHHQRGTMDPDRSHLMQSLGVHWNPDVCTWDFNFVSLLQFRDREGHMRVPVRHVEDGQKLGMWVRKHRYKKNAGTLDTEKVRRLNAIGFIWNAGDGKWDLMMRALTQFEQREGHCNVTHKHIEYLDGEVKLRLGVWLFYQRSSPRRGKLNSKKAELLERLGVFAYPPGSAYLKAPDSSDWDTFFQLFKQFKEREGHCRVPIHHLESGKKLGFWLMVQNNNRKSATIDDERRDLLQSLGVDWTPPVSLWDFNFLLLVQFRDREGHLRLSFRHVEDGQNVGAWIGVQRNKKKHGTLVPQEERRLNEIGFIWNAADEKKWDTMWRCLTQFNQREGHRNVSDQHIEYLDDGVKHELGAWLKYQRMHEGRDMFETSQEHFDGNFDLLLAFKEREGHVLVPAKHQESANDNLGMWLAGQLSLYLHGLLELDRQKWLEVAGVAWEKLGACC
jgi:hypothetical protein